MGLSSWPGERKALALDRLLFRKGTISLGDLWAGSGEGGVVCEPLGTK